MAQKDILTIGILAHVDAGKTSLTECLLHKSGATKAQGSVDKGSAITDGLSMEKSRGISIKTATVDFEWQGKHINLVDTPGHVDFSAEVDRALSVLDLVILVVSAKEGIQAHTLSLWESVRERELPVLVFVNKVDREGADLEKVFADFESDLGAKLFALNLADLSEPGDPKLVRFEDFQSYVQAPIVDRSFENLAEVNDAFFEDYIEGNIGDLIAIEQKGRDAIQSKSLVGLVFGSAKLDMGIDLLLDQIANSYSVPTESYETPVAKIFKVEYDPKLGRLAHFRSYGSTIRSKDVIWSQSLGHTFKINQLYKPNLGSLRQVSELLAGEIGMMTNSEILPVGDILGEHQFKGEFKALSESVLSVQAVAEDDKDYQKLGEALEILNIEDPQLEFAWFKEEGEFHLKILGPIQTEVLKESLEERFSIVANFMSPQVIYKETPSKSAQGYVRYWMPKPCWAIMTFQIEPGPLGSGVVFNSKVRTTDISVKYVNEVKRSIPWSLKQGILGWEVTDLDITLVEGTEHTVHSNPGDFLLATPMGIMRGLELAGTDLLEPMYAFEIKAHQDFLGPVSSDLNQMMAQLNAPVFQDNFFTITGRVSVDKAMNYSIKFNATTSGKGRLKFTNDGYEKTTTSDEKIRAFKGVSPLDESQWILHNRGAFKADER
jgi:ribosomal protection tetracycline resistance protein